MIVKMSGDRYGELVVCQQCRKFVYDMYNIDYTRYLCSVKLVRIFTKIITGFVLLTIFVYLNYQYNMPVFHVFRNRNADAPCVLPVFDIHDHSVDQFFWKQQPLPCENWLDLFYVNYTGYLIMNTTAVKISKFTSINCKYRYIERKSEGEVTFSKKYIYSGPSYLSGDFTHVECFQDKHSVYNNLHVNIDFKSILKQRTLTNENKENLSVYIVGLDSVSRLIAERKLQKTMKFIRDQLGGYVFEGYTRLADSSYPNIVSMFTGMFYTDRRLESLNMSDRLFIFKNFSNRGAVTLFGEDWVDVASFKGFTSQPTEHYIESFMRATSIIRSTNVPVDIAFKFLQNYNIPLKKVSALCFGNKKLHNIFIDYYKRFIYSYSGKRKFAYSWINELAHDFFNMVELADDDFVNFFKWMKDSGSLDNAVLVFVSDHGPRYSEIQNTDIGRLSNLLPLLSIVIPDHIKSKYPHIHKNMKLNTHRLITLMDVYEMLANVLDGNFKSGEQNQPVSKGLSLFGEIPSNRSCTEAGVSEHYCPCYTSKPVSVYDQRAISSARVVVHKINNLLNDFNTKCAKLKLATIHRVSLTYADMQRDAKMERSISLRSYLWTIKQSTRFLITLRTLPGNALFEATVEYGTEEDIRILGDINRVNKYGNQSACINDRFRRIYCFCQ